MWTQLESKLIEWEKKFVKMWTKELRDQEKKLQGRVDLDREYVSKELPLLKTEKHAVEVRLKKIEELIAKNRILIDDLNEELCRDLSGGHSLAAIGEALRDEFGIRLKKDYSEGRNKFREFLESHYKIGKAKSRDLFSLLEEIKSLHYQVDFKDRPKDSPLIYHAPGELSPATRSKVIYHLDGCWEIRA